MKRETINYFAVGLFVLAGLSLLLFVMYRLMSGVGERDVYFTRYTNVAGLNAGTPVTYEGYTFGHVAGIEPHRDAGGMHYRVRLHVHKGWQIPEDSVARISSQGLLAETVVNIDEGGSPLFLAPGDELRGAQGVDLFAAVGALAADFSDLSDTAIRPLLESLNGSVRQVGGELSRRLPVILDDMQKLLAKLDQSATHLSGIFNANTEGQARRVLDNVEVAAADLRALVSGLVDVRRDAQTLLRNLDGLVTSSQPDVQQAVAGLRHTLEQVARYSDGILQNLDSTSRNMAEFSRQIRANPARLLGGAAPLDAGVRP